ncbi:hypothetical protein BX616_005419 [Lobosporangium transversale]|uniref:Centromere-associated protein K-domain-containing protein n=1 Tax=Lobosporangium transversale TaxID=64571 RepID=A0A1Y2GEI3_9FUNG|nr:centromere-associated protein K-domain-containing protein [Lobosporangium transversale]KAF9919376.1 hypothetical protein BX616_005419 [Lobosporangium transversale]ORZ05527.1 centromere-associated protein K-domain-containing protein [Lobosporangium transversale]|eukprot:XP_021877101.1 centromere-associated protein K-domain-containing protein [Lobosporangium transversale]
MDPIDPRITTQDHIFADTSASTILPLRDKETKQVIDAARQHLSSDSGSVGESQRPPPLPQQSLPESIHEIKVAPEYIREREDVLRTTGEILYQRCIVKMEHLQQLKDKYVKNQQQFSSSLSNSGRTIQSQHLNTQQVAILRLEEIRLQAELDKIRAKQESAPDILPEVTKVRVRRMVQDSIQSYAQMTPRLSMELEETKAELASENQLLKELKEIHRALQARRRDLKKSVESGINQEIVQERQKLQQLRDHTGELMKELVHFLAKHHPPIQPDPDEKAEFELKHILEDIMNLSVSQPEDPYVVLVPGKYYPPHIEHLINAGIAVRHPRDSQKLRLINFYS